MARVKWNANGAIKIVSRSGQAGLLDIMSKVLDASQAQVPLDTGDLRESGHLRVTSAGVQIAYSDPKALDQHENLEYKHTDGRKAKYLEDPFHDFVPGARRTVGEHIARGLKGG
jgi:hypothetical protein